MTYSAGQILLASDLNASLTRIAARGNRTSSSSTANSTTFVSILRLDSVAIVSGMSYEIHWSPIIFDSTVAGDLMEVACFVSTAGAATSASTHLGAVVDDSKTATGNQKVKGATFLYNSSVTGNLSILAAIARTGGSGNVRVASTANYPFDMWVTTLGASPSDTGVDL